MRRAPLLLAAALTLACASIEAAAQDRSPRRDGAFHGEKHFRDGRRDWHRGDRHFHRPHFHRPHFHQPHFHLHGSAPHRPWRYYDPYWDWPAPVFAYPYYEPVVVERVYEVPPPPPPYFGEPVERPVPYRERSYAEARPSQPAPRAAIVQPPRLERYTLSAKELFEFDKATLRRPQPKLDEIARAMKENPKIDDVTITGHTDRLGSEAYNLDLSMRRATAVKNYLVEKGVEARRLKAVGKGEANPVVDCKETDKAALIKCLEPNRRVEVEQITVERRVDEARRVDESRRVELPRRAN